MIAKLSIANFKSIRQLDLDCKRINLFIGEPNMPLKHQGARYLLV